MNATPHPFWRDQCVLVTGASSGIGRALATAGPAGAKVGLIARRTTFLAELVEKIAGQGGRAAAAAADVADLDATLDAVKTLEGQLGPCDVLVANAGIYRKTNGRDFDPLKADRVVAVNLQGVIHAVGAVLPGMVRRRRGRLAAVSASPESSPCRAAPPMPPARPPSRKCWNACGSISAGWASA